MNADDYRFLTAKCSRCAFVWVARLLPADVQINARMLANVTCPTCGADGPDLASLDDCRRLARELIAKLDE